MGLGIKMLNPGNYRTMVMVMKLSGSLMAHTKKRCAYCDMDMGLGDDFMVIEFVEHLEEKHSDKIEPKDIKHFRKLIKKIKL